MKEGAERRVVIPSAAQLWARGPDWRRAVFGLSLLFPCGNCGGLTCPAGLEVRLGRWSLN